MGEWLNQHNNFKYFCAVGNDGDSGYNHIVRINNIIGVGAYKLMVDGTLVISSYSSETGYIDFMSPSMININIRATKNNDEGYPNTGTSFSTPWLCGMACLVDEFFLLIKLVNHYIIRKCMNF